MRSLFRRFSTAVGLLPLVAALSLPGHGLAQESPATVFERLSGGDRLEVVAPGLWITDATIREVGADSVLLGSQGSLVPVAYDEIESIAVRRGRARSGMLFGAGAGLLAGGAFGALIKSFGCTDPTSCADADRSGVVGGAVVGALIGAGVGYWFGSRSIRWQPVFPSRR